jgi:hypothetical protein
MLMHEGNHCRGVLVTLEVPSCNGLETPISYAKLKTIQNGLSCRFKARTADT